METIALYVGEVLASILSFLFVIAIYIGIILIIAVLFAIPARGLGKMIAKRRVPNPDYIVGNKGVAKEWLRLVIHVVVALSVASVLYVIIGSTAAKYSSLFFVGLPIILGLSVFLLPESQSRYVNMAKLVTVFLGLSLWGFGEGLICVLMAAPIFYMVGAAVVAGYEHVNRAAVPAAVGLLVILCLEGVHPALSFNRQHSASAEGVVPLSVAQVKSNLTGNPELTELPLDFMLLLGFPVPVSATGTGLNAGDAREFSFKRRDGVMETVRFEVAGASASHVALVPVFDNTVISQWLGWQGTKISWEALGDHSTKVSVVMQFERHLDPGWYFAPLQKWIVGKAASVMIHHAGMSPLSE